MWYRKSHRLEITLCRPGSAVHHAGCCSLVGNTLAYESQTHLHFYIYGIYHTPLSRPPPGAIYG
uniref:Uncharacterized protein n=1 Tax=Denticeps clupeoides TaxID=299321 RepID=A0AAY4APA8_9TELE